MKNSDIENLNLAIGICFSRGNLTEEQCELIRNLDATCCSALQNNQQFGKNYSQISTTIPN